MIHPDAASEGRRRLAGKAEALKAVRSSDPVARRRASAAPAGDNDAELLVLGSGPGGYTAAFRAADLGLEVMLVERYPRSAASA